MRYTSAIDRWLLVVTVAGCVVVPVGLLGALLYTLWLGDYAAVTGLAVGLLIAVISIAGSYAMAWPCYYALHEDHLEIRCGMIHERIPYARIRAAELSRNPLAGPAWSLNRIKISKDRGFTLISPKDREGFLAELERRAGRRLRAES